MTSDDALDCLPHQVLLEMPSWLSTLMLFSPQASVAMSVAMTQQQQEPLTEQAQSSSPNTSVEVAAHVAGVPLNTALSTASHSMRGQEFPCAQHGAGGASVREVPCALDLAMAANALVDARLHAMPQAEWLGAIGGVGSRRRLPYLVSPPPPAPLTQCRARCIRVSVCPQCPVRSWMTLRPSPSERTTICGSS